MNTTWTWVLVSSADTISVIHLRVTRSITAVTAVVGHPEKWVVS